MIKRYFEITISDYNLIEREGLISHLKKWYNIFPIKWFDESIRKEFKILIKKINGSIDSKDEERENALWQLESIQKINHLDNAYNGLYNALKLQSKANGEVKHLRGITKRWVKLSTNKNIKKYTETVKKHSGIEIKTANDIEKLRKLIEFRKDKYTENFTTEETTDKKIYLMGYVLGVYSKLNTSFNPDELTVINFLSARDEALRIPEKKQ